MTSPDLVLTTGLAAAAVSVAFPLLQLRSVLAARSTAGVSDVSWLLTALTATTWLAYSLAARDVVQVVTNLTVVATALWLLALVHREHPLPPRHVLACVALAALASLASTSGPLAASAAVATLSVVVCAHQGLTVLRADDVSGLSPLPWAAAAASQVLWAVYGVWTDQLPLMVNGPLAAALCTALAVLVRRARSTRPSPAAR